MTNRELLEAAAKAAGLDVDGYTPVESLEGWICVRPADEKCQFESVWAPLTDDGDALRLAVKLQMIVDFSQDDGPLDVLPVIARGCVHDKADPYAATRRSIVMCAAAMGEKA